MGPHFHDHHRFCWQKGGLKMATFAIGSIKFGNMEENSTAVVEAIAEFNHKLPYHAYIQFAGNADVFWRWLSPIHAWGPQYIAFQISDSIITQSANKLFPVYDSIYSSSSEDIHYSLIQLFSFVFQIYHAESIYFAIMDTYEPVKPEMFQKIELQELEQCFRNQFTDRRENIYLKLYLGKRLEAQENEQNRH
jgi:hypothetical protein